MNSPDAIECRSQVVGERGLVQRPGGCLVGFEHRVNDSGITNPWKLVLEAPEPLVSETVAHIEAAVSDGQGIEVQNGDAAWPDDELGFVEIAVDKSVRVGRCGRRPAVPTGFGRRLAAMRPRSRQSRRREVSSILPGWVIPRSPPDGHGLTASCGPVRRIVGRAWANRGADGAACLVRV